MRLFCAVWYAACDLHLKQVAYGVGYPQINTEMRSDDNGPVGGSTHSHVTASGRGEAAERSGEIK